MSTGMVLVNPDAVKICTALSANWPFTSGTGRVSGPAPRTMVISLVIADVWLTGGLVPRTLSFISGVDGDDDGRNFSKPAAVSFSTASA